jgi:hypothetical protein
MPNMTKFELPEDKSLDCKIEDGITNCWVDVVKNFKNVKKIRLKGIIDYEVEDAEIELSITSSEEQYCNVLEEGDHIKLICFSYF